MSFASLIWIFAPAISSPPTFTLLNTTSFSTSSLGKIYEVKDGKLVNPDNPVSEVNGSTNLKPDATGKGEWTLNFGKLNLEAGKSYVVFEKVVSLENVIDTDGDGKPDKKQELTHEDPKDKSQTFTVLPSTSYSTFG